MYELQYNMNCAIVRMGKITPMGDKATYVSAPNLIIDEERVGHATRLGGEHRLLDEWRIRMCDRANATENRLLKMKIRWVGGYEKDRHEYAKN